MAHEKVLEKGISSVKNLTKNNTIIGWKTAHRG